eukprot:COSAG02_NODE_3584_length_6524_cov_7.274934_3_plen_754_part_00
MPGLDKQRLLERVAQDGNALFFAAAELRADKEIVATAVAQWGHALRYAAEELQADREIVATAVAQDGNALFFAAGELRADKEIVATAVAQKGHALRYAAGGLQADREIVATAVAQDGHALQYAAEELRADKEIVATAVAQNGLALRYAAAELQADREIVAAGQPHAATASHGRGAGVQRDLATAMDNGAELVELEITGAEEGVPPAQAESLDQTCSQIVGIWRRHGRVDKIAELHELIRLAGCADALLEKVQQKYTQRADALGRADKPIPAGTHIAVAGRGRGTCVSCTEHWIGANDHTIAFDSGSTVTLKLRDEDWTVFEREMATILEPEPEPEPEPTFGDIEELSVEVLLAVCARLDSPKDLGHLACASSSFGRPIEWPSEDGNAPERRSVVEQTARQWVGARATEQQQTVLAAAWPSWVRRMQEILAPAAVFSHLYGWKPEGTYPTEKIIDSKQAYLSEGGSVVTLTGAQIIGPGGSPTYDWATCTAASAVVMRSGRHYAAFTVLGVHQRDGVYFGLIRPTHGDINDCRMAGGMQGECFYFTQTGRCDDREWQGMQAAGQGDTIGLLLDFGSGSLTVFHNGDRLGVMVTGLEGEYRWAAQLVSQHDCVRIAPTPSWGAAWRRRRYQEQPGRRAAPMINESWLPSVELSMVGAVETILADSRILPVEQQRYIASWRSMRDRSRAAPRSGTTTTAQVAPSGPKWVVAPTAEEVAAAVAYAKDRLLYDARGRPHGCAPPGQAWDYELGAWKDA